MWWSPCPSRECPDEEELNIIVDLCVDHCVLLELEQNPKIEIIPQQSTKSPVIRTGNANQEDDLNFKISKKKNMNQTQLKVLTEQTTDASIQMSSESPYKYINKSLVNLTDFDMDAVVDDESEDEDEDDEESWVAGSGGSHTNFFLSFHIDGFISMKFPESVHLLLDMHPDLGDPIEQLGIEIEDSNDDNVTDFKQRFGEKLLWDKGVNVTALEEEDLRCGGLVLRHNMTISEDRLKMLAEDCMVQKCEFLSGGPEICIVIIINIDKM